MWAKSTQVSRDFKRIFGRGHDKRWVRGKATKVEGRKAHDASKQKTTYVTAEYACGVQADGSPFFKPKELVLGQLKEKDPNAVASTVPTTATTATAPPAASTTTTTATATPPTTTAQLPPLRPTDPVDENPNTSEEEMETPHPPTPPPPPRNTTTAPFTGATTLSDLTEDTATSNTPVAEAHGRKWYHGNTKADVNGKYPAKYWKMTDQYGRGREYTPGCDHGKDELRPIDYFLACMPKEQLQEMESRTSVKLAKHGKSPTSVGEVLKFFGVLILCTRFEFGNRASLWATESFTRLIPPANFGYTTGMPRKRFDDLWRFMVWSHCEEVRPNDMTHEQWRWSLVEDFLDNFNNHRKKHWTASNVICVDESISRWYGLGGSWINKSLPHYVAMDRKTEHGCEIQNACDGMCGVMMRLKLVKTAEQEAVDAKEREARAFAKSK